MLIEIESIRGAYIAGYIYEVLLGENGRRCFGLADEILQAIWDDDIERLPATLEAFHIEHGEGRQ